MTAVLALGIPDDRETGSREGSFFGVRSAGIRPSPTGGNSVVRVVSLYLTGRGFDSLPPYVPSWLDWTRRLITDQVHAGSNPAGGTCGTVLNVL